MKKNIYSNLIIFFLLLGGAYTLKAQISEGGIPYSIKQNIKGSIETITMPSVDVERLLEEDENDSKLGIPLRFGKDHSVNLDMNNSGTWTELSDGSKLWRLRIVCPDAFTTNLLYDWFWMPEGAKFFLYNDDKSEIIGAFTEKNNKEHGEFATSLISGEAVTLEYYQPALVDKPGIISISTVVHGYRDILSKYFVRDFGSSGSCNNNVACEVGDDWHDEIRSVAMIIVGGSRMCSGSLVNNTSGDLEQLFLTANHCLIGNVSSWVFMFNYDSPQCSPNQDGPTSMTVQGSTLLASNSASDFALVKITEAIPQDYNVHWAGWSAINEPSEYSVGIHHPAGDVKKISFDYDPSVTSDYDPSPYLANSHWEVTAWDDGTTEPGSSGSPLFNQDKKIIGQLHGGWASCSSITEDYYGKFSMSWDRGTTPSTRLKDWLDPENTGILEIDGFDPSLGNPDLIPPSAITDLEVEDITSMGLTLTWSAPFDTSYGGVRQYDIRYSQNPIADTNDFKNADELNFAGAPADSGESESLILNGLEFNTTYYFAIRSNDRWNNVSELSNVVSAATFEAPQILVTPNQISHSVNVGDVLSDTLKISNITSVNSTLQYAVTLENNTFPEKAAKVKFTADNKFRRNINNLDKRNPKEEYGLSFRGFGGPDLFGYEWMDSDELSGLVYQWIDISPDGTEAVNWIPTGSYDPKDEGYAGPFNIGFNFSFYDVDYNSVYISSNGFVSFTQLNSNSFSNGSIPLDDDPNGIIAPFWDDLDGSSLGKVFYKSYPDKFVIQFDGWKKYAASSSSFTFQIVIRKNGKINFYYNNMSGTLTSATVGIENQDGTDGLQVVKDAAYIKNNFALEFAAEPEWMAMDNYEGMIYNGNSANMVIEFLTDDLTPGLYSMDVVIESNDPNNSSITVPVSLNLSGGEIPVELTSFNAEKNEKVIQISWSTATETNNLGFEIERKSKDNWENISFVSGKGTTTELSKYYFEDEISSIKSNKVSYRLKQIDFDGKFNFSDVIEIDLTPSAYELSQNYPNPFNPVTKINFALPFKSDLQLTVYNTLGQKLAVIENGIKDAGYYEVIWNASDLASGLYLYVISAKSLENNDEFRNVKKMLLIK
ncbi:MAG: hypothetical protein CMF23_09660 [Ignavibacteriae bacterium]|nr:hypothetical protein [Ignavibacteriota bacterium]